MSENNAHQWKISLMREIRLTSKNNANRYYHSWVLLVSVIFYLWALFLLVNVIFTCKHYFYLWALFFLLSIIFTCEHNLLFFTRKHYYRSPVLLASIIWSVIIACELYYSWRGNNTCWWRSEEHSWVNKTCWWS
jgi:hypothetical protein